MVIPRSPKLRARSWVDRRATSRLLAAALAVVAAGAAGAAHAQAAHADTAPPAAYGEVSHFGGFDPTGAVSGKFVLPIGFAVDNSDSSTPDGTAIWVLDAKNPFVLSSGIDGTVHYRLQKLDDQGNVLGTAEFDMASPADDPRWHPQFLAVDPASHRVYLQLSGTPEGPAVLTRIVAWSTTPNGSKQLVAPSDLTADPDVPGTGTFASGLDRLTFAGQGAQTGLGSVSGMAVAQGPTGTDLYVGGVTLGNSNATIIALKTQGADAGQVDGTWTNTWPSSLGSIYQPTATEGLTTTPDGRLLGSFNTTSHEAFQVGEFGTDMNVSQMVLPTSEQLADNFGNPDLAPANFDGPIQSFSAGNGSSRMELVPDTAALTNGLYASPVARSFGNDLQNPLSQTAEVPPLMPWHWEGTFSWDLNGTPGYQPASLAIQLHDASGNLTGVIANPTAGGTCNIQGGLSSGSDMQIASGNNGAVFALVQPDLTADGSDSNGDGPYVSDLSQAYGGGAGDEVMEFAPGAGTACPTPSGDFTITPPGGTATDGDVTVNVGDTVDVDASGVDLLGSAPFEYDWDWNGDGTAVTRDGFVQPQIGQPTWPVAQDTSPRFERAGTYTLGLTVQSAYGTYTTSHRVTVVDPGEAATHADLQVTGSASRVGDTFDFTAAGSAIPSGDAFDNFSWDFGDGVTDTTGSDPTDTHKYTAAGDYPVTVSFTTTGGRTATTTRTVHVDPADTGDHTGTTTDQTPPPVTTDQTPPPATTGQTPPPPPARAATTPATKVTAPSAKVSAGKIAVGFKPSAAGTVTIRLTAKVGKRTVVVGTARATVKAGKVVSLKVTPTKAGKKLLAKKTKVTTTITLKPKSGKGVTVTKSASLKLTAAKPKHKK